MSSSLLLFTEEEEEEVRHGVNPTDTLALTYFHTCMHPAWRQRARARTGEDEVLSGSTVLDRNRWMRTEKMQCVSRGLTRNTSAEPLVILAHYNIPGRDISRESIGFLFLFFFFPLSRPQRC